MQGLQAVARRADMLAFHGLQQYPTAVFAVRVQKGSPMREKSDRWAIGDFRHRMGGKRADAAQSKYMDSTWSGLCLLRGGKGGD